MKLPTLLSVFLCVVLLAGSFAAGLILLHPAPGAGSQEDGANSQANNENPEPKTADPVKAEQVPHRVARQAAKQAPEEPEPLLRPQPSGRQLTLMEAAEIQQNVGRRVTWVCQPVHSQSEGGATQHIFFRKDSKGEFSFAAVFIAEEPVSYEQSPVNHFLDDLRARYMEERHQQRLEEERRRTEERDRDMEKLAKGGKDEIRKRIEESRKRLEEARQPDKLEERRAKAKGKGASPLPIYVTVTGTVTRFDTLLLLGYGQSYAVPVLRNITVNANP